METQQSKIGIVLIIILIAGGIYLFSNNRNVSDPTLGLKTNTILFSLDLYYRLFLCSFLLDHSILLGSGLLQVMALVITPIYQLNIFITIQIMISNGSTKYTLKIMLIVLLTALMKIF